jgi:hypothetical protein
VEWSSVDPSLVQVDAQGTVNPARVGVGRVVAHSGQAQDTAVVAVLGAGDLLVSALPDGGVKASHAAGETVRVPVALDLSRASGNGDLGSIEFDVTFDPKVLEYVSSSTDATGASAANLVEPGRVRFAFAGTDPQGKAQIQLLTLSLKVKADAAAGSFSPLSIVYSGVPTSTGFQVYKSPLTVAGKVVVAKKS